MVIDEFKRTKGRIAGDATVRRIARQGAGGAPPIASERLHASSHGSRVDREKIGARYPMNPYAPPQSVESNSRPRSGHVIANAVLLLCIFLLASFLSLGFYLHLRHPEHRTDTMIEGGVDVVLGGWSLLSVIVTPLAAIGLLMRRPWARIVAMAYWCLTVVTCALVPVAIYGLYSLSRPSCRAQLVAKSRA
jgi:hypothetical protein